MIGLDEAKEFVVGELRALDVEVLATADALGCALGDAVVARERVPAFENSSMDGFAVRSQETAAGAVRLLIVDSIFAGRVSRRTVAPGEAMRIMTGAAMPAGADAVCPVEDVLVEGDEVLIRRRVDPGDCVRRAGGDVEVGQLLMPAGSEVTPAALGVLAGQGMTTVRVHRRPVVAVLSTGDELSTNDQLAPGQIRDTNRPMLVALLRSSGFEPVDLGIVADGYEAIKEAISDAAQRYDAVVSTGGVSMGDVDHVKGVIGELSGGRARTMQVAIKPAKPFAFGRVGDKGTPVFGLPGNPVSTRVSFELFVRPALRLLGGHRRIERLTMDAVLDIDLPAPGDQKVHLVHVAASLGDDGRPHVVESAAHYSHLLSAIVASNAIAVLSPGHSYARGERVTIMVLDADSLASR